MDDEKARAYAELAAKMTELHASIALLSQNVDKMARTDAEVTSMTKIFQGVYVPCIQRTKADAKDELILFRGVGVLRTGSRTQQSNPSFAKHSLPARTNGTPVYALLCYETQYFAFARLTGYC
jgi:hypothetical protein